MVVVSNGWLDHAAEEVHSALRAKGLIRMSDQSIILTTNSLNTPAVPTETPPAPPATSVIQSTTINSNVSQSVAVDDGQTTTVTPPTTPKNDRTLQSPHNQQQPNSNNKVNTAARAVLICQPNSHPFQTRNILLEPNVEVKIGRSITRNRINDNNGVFECKVLSRNHAVLFYSDGKFYVRDTGSSNGTFINNQRLSQTNNQSENFEVRSGDIVQFGVDVLENSRKETHGCIIAFLKLFLPAGGAAPSNSSSCTNLPTGHLYQLNSHIQEAALRELSLDTKLMNIQKLVDTTRKTAANNWQSMIVEDRLLSRIDILENKLECFQKNITEDKLREEVIKLHEDKSIYQNSAKEALRKVYLERNEATQKLSTIERALCNSEDECALLRDQLLKTQQHFQEIAMRINVTEEKCSELTVKYQLSEKRTADLEQDEEKLYEQVRKLTVSSMALKETNDKLSQENSDLKNQIKVYQMADTDHANDSDDEFREKENVAAITNWLQENEKSCTRLNLFGKECKKKSPTNETYKSAVNEQFLIVEQSIDEFEKKLNIRNGDENSTEPKSDDSTINDGNQNNRHCTINNDTIDFNEIKSTIAQLKNLFETVDAVLLENERIGSMFKTRNLEFKEYQNEQLEKYNQLMQQKDELHTTVLDSNLQISQLKSKIALLEVKLSDYEFKKVTEQNSLALQSTNDQHHYMHPQQPPPPYVIERFDVEQQTDAIDILPINDHNCLPSLISGNNNNNNDDDVTTNSVTVIKSNNDVEDDDETTADQSICSTEMSSLNGDIITQQQQETIPFEYISESTELLKECDHIEQIIENDIKMITDPDVQREEELILFKEQCAKLTEENVTLKRQINDVLMKTNGISINSLLAIGVPLFAIIIYLFVSPYL